MARVKPSLRPLLEGLRAGSISFAEFARESAPVWERFGRYLMRRWKAPLGVELYDVQQELLLAGWQAIPKWDPNRGVPIDRFVIFQAIDKAKKWLHRQRNARRRDDKAPGRFPAGFSYLGCETAEDVDRMAWKHSDIEETLIEREEESLLCGELTRVAARLPSRERECLRLVAECGGDASSAVQLIVSDPGRRLALRVGNDAAANAIVRRSLRAAVTVLETERAGLTP